MLYLKKTHKFGVRLPKSVHKAYNIDAENVNVLFSNSISNEMTDFKVDFKDIDDGGHVPIGYAYVSCHIIFDVKKEAFFQKARLVAGVHMTDTPATINYYNVVSFGNVWLDLVIAELNYLEFK